jgi:hypothetical protein
MKNWESKGISRGGWNRGASTPRDGSVHPNDALGGLNDALGGLNDALGGLADEDADSERPASQTSNGRDAMRKNEASL